MALRFEPVETDGEIRLTARAADEIWHEYWPALIGRGQTDYMLDTMQSVPAIERDIREEGYRYWLLFDEEDTLVGYTCALAEDFSEDPVSPGAGRHGLEISKRAARRLFISKIYLYADHRGKHYASRVIDFYGRLCREEGLDAMYLTVNRGNELAIRAYLGRGFEVIEDLDAEIGCGYVMNDHIMCKMA